MTSSRRRGAAYGLTAAALFGVSPPLAKLLLPEAGPILMAGLLYLGAGLGLLVFEALFYHGSEASRREAQVGPSDRWLLVAIVLAGGVLGPVFMLWGLQHVSAVLASLLLNLEAPLTIGLAVVLFREHLARQEVAGTILILGGAVVLSYHPAALFTDLWGFLAIGGACLCWALDNNLTQRLSLRDPVVVTRIKTLSAGACSLALAAATGQSMPGLWVFGCTLALGLISYGLSLVLDTYALRLLGAAREAGFFATAPFIGAVAAVPILREQWDGRDFLAAGLMAAGVVLLLRAHHAHEHTHEELEHDHAHRHRDHHEHEHGETQAVDEPHAHRHRHVALTHDHAHVSELHHRHDHR
jgi:drug/metabolite transporter (DMT)-like permease